MTNETQNLQQQADKKDVPDVIYRPLLNIERTRTTGETNDTTTIEFANGYRATTTFDQYGRVVETKDNDVTKTTNQYVNNRLDTHIDNYTGTVVKYSYNNSGELQQVNETKDNSLVSRVSAMKNTYGMLGAKIVLLGDNTVVRNNYTYKDDPFNRCLVGESILLDDTQKANVTYTCDKFGRLTSKNVPFAMSYEYNAVGSKLTNQVKKVTYDDGSYDEYAYDKNGNIVKVSLSNGDTIEYTYDSFNRLIEEVNCAFNQRTLITYDKGGNITQKRVVSCQNATDQTIDYSYDNPWKDQLTSYNGQAITYDAIGNPTSYKGNTLYWIRGRMLEAFGEKACYTYNSAGIRTEKCVKGVSTKYVIIGSQIVSEETNGIKIIYYYSTDGIIGFNYNGTDYFYRKNLQGDIIAILNTSGDIVAKYVYDAWGNHKVYNTNGSVIYDSINPTTTYANEIGCVNPFRYRSYYFDNETGLYYLNSRYYDPQVGRFINADSIDYLNPENIQGLNLYSYCYNNPVNYVDPIGQFPILACILGLVALVGMGLTIGGIASNNNTLTAAGLTMVTIPALISGGLALFSGATYLSIIGGVTAFAGLGTSLFASAEYQEAFTGDNWMLDAGLNEAWYNGLIFVTSGLATAGTLSIGFLSSIGHVATPRQMLNSFQNNPSRWKIVKELIEPGRGNNKGGVSTYANYINKWTGSRLGVHKIVRGEKFIHGPHFHPWL